MHQLKGEIQFHHHRYQKAAEIFEGIVKQHPDPWEAEQAARQLKDARFLAGSHGSSGRGPLSPEAAKLRRQGKYRECATLLSKLARKKRGDLTMWAEVMYGASLCQLAAGENNRARKLHGAVLKKTRRRGKKDLLKSWEARMDWNNLMPFERFDWQTWD